MVTTHTPCGYCEEAVTLQEQHPNFREPMHFACGLRAVAGSLGHLMRVCRCFVPPSLDGPEPEEDPPGMTKRQAAQIAFDYFRELEELNQKYDRLKCGAREHDH